ncbi:MAG: Zn-ribbon domain-containing OB-fold protein [Deltaproteobacteria bacterium]|nr:MAG: Zn-ribbon domain-containing OB-fold protein [Deltaproteobacteria bacterium]
MAKKEADDRFKRFGRISFTAITRANDFIGYLEEGKVMGTRCKECGAIYFPPRSDCFRCLRSDTEWFEISGTGRLLSFSQLNYGPAGFEDDLPYTIALLDYGEYKVFGKISKDIPYEDLNVGMELRTEVDTLPNGQLSYVFKMP